MAPLADNTLEAGRDAARRHAWRDAYELLRSADEDGELAADAGEGGQFDIVAHEVAAEAVPARHAAEVRDDLGVDAPVRDVGAARVASPP